MSDNLSLKNTIYAPATLIGAAGLTVFRVSGRAAFTGLTSILKTQDIPAFRQATLCKLYHPVTAELLDEALVITFKTPNSFTGEDVVEYHCHGGRAVANRMLQAFSTLDDHRLAEAGEFTRRAFENDRLDLTQAEAVADLIHAQTEIQASLALSQLGGTLRDLYDGWGTKLKNMMAYVEADIDFADEDVPDALSDAVRPKLKELHGEISTHLDDKNLGERLRDGFKIAIIGAPNAGKSSLMNVLAKRDVAIVTDIAGTTRDVLEVPLNLGGIPVVLADTAGLRDTTDTIEGEGINRAKNWAKTADIALILKDGTHLSTKTDTYIDDLRLETEKIIHVSTKADHDGFKQHNKSDLSISVHRGETISNLITHLTDIVRSLAFSGDSDSAPRGLITRTRHRSALSEAISHIDRALEAPEIDMMAEDVRLSLRAIGRITGRVDVEDLLDVIFNDFCIGK